MWFVNEIVAHLYWNNAYKVAAEALRLDTPNKARPPVVVTLDRRVELTPARAAAVLEQLHRLGAARVFFDDNVPVDPLPGGNDRMIAAVRAFGPSLAFVVRSEKAEQDPDLLRFPPPEIVGRASTVISLWELNFLHYATRTPYSFSIDGRRYPSFSAALSDPQGLDRHRRIYPDFSLSANDEVQVSADAVVRGTVSRSQIAGRTVVLASLDRAPGMGFFGQPPKPPLIIDIAGARALAKPLSVAVGPVPLLAFAVALVLLGRRSRNGLLKAMIYALTVCVIFVVPVPARRYGIVLGPETAILFLPLYGALRAWQRRMRRIRHTNSSGLPNLLAFSNSVLPPGQDIFVAAVARYEEILATLPKDLHAECARQIARRLSVGSGASEIFQGEGGHFAWSEEARPLDVQLGHVEGLRALFSAPLQLGEHTFDTNIHFGLDRNEGLDTSTRVNSALASATEALGNGRAVELYEAQRLADAPWELSLHARIDEGLRNGDIWLAFQAQWNLAENRMCGAEALIRWNHPTRGPIAPDAFILQAERAGRIDSLTYWVLEQAITAAHELNAIGPRFQMSVNLSAQMVDKADLVANFAEIVRRRKIDPSLLTVEVTETSSVRNRPAACHNLTQLRQLGFRLSIDDFGTGEASLAYLADLPSDELKIDRRFVAKLTSSDRDRTIVQNTIALAHALHQEVVAEGIEDAATAAMLRDLGCDFAQGYHLGRPKPFDAFVADYAATISGESRTV